MEWENKTQEKFRSMIAKIPVFHRHITEVAVIKSAEECAKTRGALHVEEQDVIAAFFPGSPARFTV